MAHGADCALELLELLDRGASPLPRPRPRRRSWRLLERLLPPLLDRGAVEEEDPSLWPVDAELEEPLGLSP